MAAESAHSPQPHFVVAATGTYAHWPPLPEAVADADKIADLLAQREMKTDRLIDRTEQQLLQELESLLPPTNGEPSGVLVVFCSGHGEPTPRSAGLRLIASDSAKGATAKITADYVIEVAARSGSAQILLIFDTCYAGTANPGMSIASAVLGDKPPGELWVGLLTSTMDWEKARDGRFGKLLASLIEHGPTSAEGKLRWSIRNEGITGDALICGLMAEWHYRDQRPQYQTWGSGGLPEVLIPNPLHKVSAPARVVEQLVLAAQGSDPGEDAWYFTGRQAVMAKLVGWVSAREPGMFVLTGPAGCGKSAVLGQLACLSDTDQRAQLLRERPLESADPGVGSVHANVSAHASSVTQLVRAIDEQLSDRGVIAGDRRGVRGRRELLNSLDLATICPVIVIDGLDEAVDEVWTILEQLLKPLAARCMLLIGTRELTPPAGGLPLTTQLQPDSARVISLLDEVDDDADIRAYVQRRLGGRDLRMSPPLVAEALLAEREHPGDGLFLLAHIVTAQLRAEPVDTAASGWHEQLSHSVEEAFDHDLAAAPPLEREGQDVQPYAARDLLAALAWSFGSGMPDDVWPVVAQAISDRNYSTDDVYWAMQVVGRYVIEDAEGGRAVYRPTHQRLASHLRQGSAADTATAIANAVTEYYRRILATGRDPSQHAYLFRWMWRHCLAAGVPGLTLLESLARDYPAQTQPDLALALRSFGQRQSNSGSVQAAIQALSHAVSIYAQLQDIDYTADLARTLDSLSVAYAKGADARALKTSQDAVDLYEAIARSYPASRDWYASALLNLGARYKEADQPEKALEVTAHAGRLYRELAARNPAYRPDLATAAFNISLAYRLAHQPVLALDAAQVASQLFSELAKENSGYVPQLAQASIQAGILYAETDQPERAVDVLTPGVEMLARIGPDSSQMKILGTGYTTLARIHKSGNRPKQAIEAAENAIGVYSILAAQNDSFVPRLILNLNGLTSLYTSMGQQLDADAAWRQAVAALDDSDSKVRLLTAEARLAPPARAANALFDALTVEPSPGFAFAVRQACRVRYAAAPDAFDEAWRRRFTEDPPAWLHIDPTLVERLQELLVAPTAEEADQLIAANTRLFASADALAALDDVGPVLTDDAEIINAWRGALTELRDAAEAGAPLPREDPRRT